MISVHVHEVLAQKGTDVLTANVGDTVYDSIARMVDLNVGSILVVDGNEVAGIFTERDYLRRIVLEGRTSKTTRVEEVMTADVIVVPPTQTVSECLAIMTEAKCRHLPVVEDGILAGIISIGDCAKEVSRAAVSEITHLESYIQTYLMGRYPA